VTDLPPSFHVGAPPTGRLPRWLVWTWAALLGLTGVGWLIPSNYHLSTASIEVLTTAPNSQPYGGMIGGTHSVTLPTLKGFYAAEMPDHRWLVIDSEYLYIFDPQQRTFQRPSGLLMNLNLGSGVTGTREGSIGEGGIYNNYAATVSCLTLGDQVAAIGGSTISLIAEGGIRSYHLDTDMGIAPFVAKLSDHEIAIAGASPDGLTDPLPRNLTSFTNQSKIFKYDLNSQQLSDTGKRTPVPFGNSYGGFLLGETTSYDFGNQVLVWQRRSGKLFLFTKRTLSFKQIAEGLTDAKQSGNLFYQMYPVSASTVLLAPTLLTMTDPLYLYNVRLGRLSKFQLAQYASPEIWARTKNANLRDLSGKDIKYTSQVFGGRFLSLLPYQSASFSSQLKDLWSHRLIFDLGDKQFVDVAGQSTRTAAQMTASDNVSFVSSVKLSTSQFWLLGNLDAIYAPGVTLAPLNWLTWEQLSYPLSFICLSLLLGALLMGYRYWRRVS
jgi:hypothetical protein